MQVRLSVVPWLQGTTSTYESARGRRAGDTARKREGGDAPERVLEEFLARLLRVGQALDLVDGLLVRAYVPQLQEGGIRSQLARLQDPEQLTAAAVCSGRRARGDEADAPRRTQR